MTEYWQSQARKFCDFCKCWLSDNKVSISYHENGKKHKEAVQRHISTLSKKSAKDQKAKDKMDDEIKKMEAAAMAAYMKDVQNNADITSQNLNAMLGNGPSSSSAPAATPAPAPAPPPKKAAVWHEVKTDDASYFWNTETNETTWDPPDDYLSLAQLEAQKLKEKENKKKAEKLKKEKADEQKEEVRAHFAREKMRDRAVPVTPQPTLAPVDYGPAPRPGGPYGGWTAVVNEPQEIDLQLPKGREKPPPPVVATPEEIRFKQRKVESLGDGPVEFKKRKISANRNARQKCDDD